MNTKLAVTLLSLSFGMTEYKLAKVSVYSSLVYLEAVKVLDRIIWLSTCVWPESLSLRTSRLRPWAAPSCDVINWTRRRSRASSCASYMCSKACLRVMSLSPALSEYLKSLFDTGTLSSFTVYNQKKVCLHYFSLCISDALFTYWNKASATDLMDFFTLIEWEIIGCFFNNTYFTIKAENFTD